MKEINKPKKKEKQNENVEKSFVNALPVPH